MSHYLFSLNLWGIHKEVKLAKVQDDSDPHSKAWESAQKALVHLSLMGVILAAII